YLPQQQYLHSLPTRRSSDLISKVTEQISPTTPGGETAPATAAPTGQGTQLGGNRLIIAARSKDWERIKKLLDDLDKPQPQIAIRSEEHTSELQSRGHLVCRL